MAAFDAAAVADAVAFAEYYGKYACFHSFICIWVYLTVSGCVRLQVSQLRTVNLTKVGLLAGVKWCNYEFIYILFIVYLLPADPCPKCKGAGGYDTW